MGSGSGDSDERPVHPVQVAPCAMMRSEVTVGMFRACVGAGKCDEPHFDDGSCNRVERQHVEEGRTAAELPPGCAACGVR